jgi:hypothetical protein
MECPRWERCDGSQSGGLLEKVTPTELTGQKDTAEIEAESGVALGCSKMI